MTKDLTWIEISIENIIHNIKELKRLIDDQCLLATCVKGNAYGHGLEGIVTAITKSNINWLCVDSFQELQRVRNTGVNLPVLVIGSVSSANIISSINMNATFMVFDFEEAKRIAQICTENNITADIHIKIDTGMSRRGVMPEFAVQTVQDISNLNNIYLKGIATHFATSEYINDTDFFNEQFQTFKEFLQQLKSNKINPDLIHCSNSGATIRYSGSHFNMVRPGLAIYGHYPDKEIQKWAHQNNIFLKPALSLKSRVAYVKKIPFNSCVGYGCTIKTRRETDVAIIPIGYYDGLDRGLSNYGYALINGRRAKIIGQISMNVTVLDITGIKGVKPGDEVVLIGSQGDAEINAQEVASQLGTINYEVLTRLRESIPRYYL